MNPIVAFFNNNYTITLSLYCVLICCVVGITVFLSELSEALKIKTHLSDGVVAGILLGAITSLPELVTCITSIISSKSGAMGFGDIIGSNIFDLFVLAICLLSCVWIFRKFRSNRINTIILSCSGVGTIFVLFAMLADKYLPAMIIHGFNFFSIPILASYVVALVFIIKHGKEQKIDINQKFKNSKKHSKNKLASLSLPAMIIFIIVFSLLLIGSAMFLSYTSESLIYTHWSKVFGKSFGGAVLLGATTSLPEIVCCITLSIDREYNMLIDTMVGSTSFNLSVLSISNIIYACLSNTTGPMYEFSTENLIQVLVGIIISICMLVYLCVNNDKDKPKWSERKILTSNSALLSLSVLSYVTFIILGFIGFNN